MCAYAENYKVSKVYKNNYITRYIEVYTDVYNQMKELYKEGSPEIQSAVATVMIPFTKAAGMDMPGIITWDESEAVSDEEFKTFAEQKTRTETPQVARPTYTKPAQEQGQQQGGYQKKQYTGPTELKGEATAVQVNKINEYLNDMNAKVSDMATSMLQKLDVAGPEDLSKQEASDIIGACIGEKKKTSYAKKY